MFSKEAKMTQFIARKYSMNNLHVLKPNEAK